MCTVKMFKNIFVYQMNNSKKFDPTEKAHESNARTLLDVTLADFEKLIKLDLKICWFCRHSTGSTRNVQFKKLFSWSFLKKRIFFTHK